KQRLSKVSLKCSIVPLRHGSRGGTNSGVTPSGTSTRTTSPIPVGATNGPPLSNCAPRQPEAAPERVQGVDHPRVGAVVDDLDGGLVRGHVDLVERVKAHPTVEVARTDEIDLHERPRAAWPPAPGRGCP